MCWWVKLFSHPVSLCFSLVSLRRRSMRSRKENMCGCALFSLLTMLLAGHSKVPAQTPKHLRRRDVFNVLRFSALLEIPQLSSQVRLLLLEHKVLSFSVDSILPLANSFFIFNITCSWNQEAVRSSKASSSSFLKRNVVESKLRMLRASESPTERESLR